MESMDNVRERFEALVQRTEPVHQHTRMVERRLRGWRGIAWGVALGLLGMALGAMPVGAAPFAYVANECGGGVSVLDTATNTVVAFVPVPEGPFWVAITPDGAHAYVSNVGGTVSVLDTATHTVVTTISITGTSGDFGLAITPDGAFVYVPIPDSNRVFVIATASNMVVAEIPILEPNAGPFGAAVTSDGAFVYVTHRSLSSVSVIATATNTVVATIPVGVNPFGVVFTPDGAFAYVTNQSDNTVSVIQTATRTVVATIRVGPGPVGAAVTPNGAFVYVANDSGSPEPPTWTVSVIATATNTVVATIPVDQYPVGVAITPDGASAYVSNNGVRSVSVIATATNTVTTTVTTTDCPDGIAITPAAKPGNRCPLGQGFWKNHTGAWPVTSLTLGGKTYSQTELLAILDTLVRSDASLILADQLIAAKLNIAHGSNPAPVSATITDADSLLSGFPGKLPYHVAPSSTTGQAMINDASVLESYNNGDLTPDCQP